MSGIHQTARKRAYSSGVVNPLLGGSISSITYDDAGNGSDVTFNADGTITATTDGVSVSDSISGQRWFDGTPDQAYQVNAAIVSETGSGAKVGTFGTWLSVPQTFGAAKASGNGLQTVVFIVDIRRASDSAVVSDGENSYTATANNSTMPEP